MNFRWQPFSRIWHLSLTFHYTLYHYVLLSFPSSFNFFSVWLILSLPLTPSFLCMYVHTYVCMCVTFLPLPAASCSLLTAEPEPPPVERTRGMWGAGLQTHPMSLCPFCSPAHLHTVCAVLCLPPPRILYRQPVHMKPANLMPTYLPTYNPTPTVPVQSFLSSYPQ